jgi:hypothetical protein
VSLPDKDWNGSDSRAKHRLEQAPPDQTFSYPSCKKRNRGSPQKIRNNDQNATYRSPYRPIASAVAEQEKN